MPLIPPWQRHGWSSEEYYKASMTPEYLNELVEGQIKGIVDVDGWGADHTVVGMFHASPSHVDLLISQLQVEGFTPFACYEDFCDDSWTVDVERHACWTVSQLRDLNNFLARFAVADCIQSHGWFILPFGRED